MSEETKPTEAPAEANAEKPAATAAKPKKEKPPAVEDKPFAEFIPQHFFPALTQTLQKFAINDLELKLEKQPLPVRGLTDVNCWQVIGHMKQGQRQFRIGFIKEDISGQKFFCWADNGSSPSTMESFMIDERKVTLDLMVLYTVQRLNGQKWLTVN